jgi:hypothetical protein
VVLGALVRDHSTTNETIGERAEILQERLLRATIPYRFMGLGLHMAEHSLPPYLDLEIPAECRPLKRLMVQVDAATARRGSARSRSMASPRSRSITTTTHSSPSSTSWGRVA